MPGSLGRCIGPVPIATKRARMASPRSVPISQRDVASSHSSEVTSVENKARWYRP